jgi:hypothetical protein
MGSGNPMIPHGKPSLHDEASLWKTAKTIKGHYLSTKKSSLELDTFRGRYQSETIGMGGYLRRSTLWCCPGRLFLHRFIPKRRPGLPSVVVVSCFLLARLGIWYPSDLLFDLL